ncbi:hypothetical protein [Sphingomonas sp. MMS24-J13]|uniref:hypothetical protein n=1 Tax=Sphingomonas sp. MMS24-J13 TaxID=3238686 RepID=UPI0038516AAC
MNTMAQGKNRERSARRLCIVVRWSACAALPLLLSGCGGGGGVASTPTPIVTPSDPGIAAPQTASANTTLGGPLASQAFATLAVRATVTQSASALSSANAINPGTGASISYDAASNTYTVSSPGTAASGNAPDRATLIPNDTAITSAANVCIGTSCQSDRVIAFLSREGTNRPATQPYFIYSYVGYANWWSVANSGANKVYAYNEAIFGIPTPVNAVPTSGTATFTLDLQGYEGTTPSLGSSGSHALGPTFAGGGTATLDFGAGSYTMTGSMGAVTAPSRGGSEETTFASSGKLLSGANGFGGTFTFNDAGTFNGKLNGWLFGPAAQEIGAVFSASAADGRVAVGTIVGHK